MTVTQAEDHNPTTAFVWVWLPGQTDPVVAGRLDHRGSVVVFTYGLSYLARDNAIALYEPELSLQRGEIAPTSGLISGCIADAGPDSWGRRVIEHRRAGSEVDLSPMAYLLESGSNRIGALDFQHSPDEYVPRTGDEAPLDELAEAADRVENGLPLTAALDRALLHATSVGGARPKAVLVTGDRQVIAKFATTTDSMPVVKGEYVAMELARLAGLDVARVHLADALGKAVLLVDRFDRNVDQTRNIVVSALTILNLHDADGIAGRYATYSDLAAHIRRRFTKPGPTLRELFARITFNVLVGNTDDHARNHAAFWDGAALTLTPAYDICPQTRTGQEATQAMAFGPDGDRMSQVAQCVVHASTYHLTPQQAREIIDHQISIISQHWHDVCDSAALSTIERDRLWGRQFLNPYALYDY